MMPRGRFREGDVENRTAPDRDARADGRIPARGVVRHPRHARSGFGGRTTLTARRGTSSKQLMGKALAG